jgi:hypothetical protein
VSATQTQYSVTTRPITEDEYRAAIGALRSPRYQAAVFSAVGIVVAVMVNFVPEEFRLTTLFVPLMFLVGAAVPAVNYRTRLRALRKILSSGMVSEIAGVPGKRKFPRSWTMGPLVFGNDGTLSKVLQEGTASRIAFIPEAKMVLSVNGVPLEKVTSIMTIPPGFGVGPPAPPRAAPAPVSPPTSTGTPRASSESQKKKKGREPSKKA